MTFDLSTFSILLQSIAVAVVIVLAVFAWRWLRVALDRGQLQAQNDAIAQIMVYARIFVAAAEQTLAKQPGFAKLDWVLAQFDEVMPDMDKQLVRSFVEAAVAGLPATQPPKTLTLAAPSTATTVTFTGTPSSPPPPANCDDLSPPATSHSHRDTKRKVGTEVK
ncbi:MAG: hypothetical protein KAX65_00080 [Caldilineaceae bacterium]|nr:hypothetical protein [Caldilineaceae bacterium]